MNKNQDLSSTNQPLEQRVNQLKRLISKVRRQISNLEKSGAVAPPTCNVIRYQIRSGKKIYYYYKLQAQEPCFSQVSNEGKLTKYLYLGKAGNSAYIEAMEQVTRRALIDELERVLSSLHEAYLDVCFGGEVKNDPDFSEGLKKDV